MAQDVKNQHLERGSRRALVGLFGEGWNLLLYLRKYVKVYSKGLGKRTTPLNIFALLFAAEHGLGKLGVLIEPWGDISEEMILSARKMIDEVLCKESESCKDSRFFYSTSSHPTEGTAPLLPATSHVRVQS